MLDNLIFCLNAVIPIFLMMILGAFFMKIKVFDEAFVNRLNSFVFKVSLPVLVFYDMSRSDFHDIWDGKFVIFCFVATVASICLTWGISFFIKNRGERGEFIQVAYRSSAAIMGIALVVNLYGSAGMTPLMILGSVPLYNVIAVTVLSLFNEENGSLDRALIIQTAGNVLKNPIIWGVFAGLAWSVADINTPQILDTSFSYVARLATPLGLMALGASFDIKKARESVTLAGLASFIKLIGLGMIIIPIAISLGYADDKLVAVLIMCCSPTTVSCYIMAKNMGHDGTLTSSTVMMTTACSAFTLTAWLFILKTIGVI